MPRNSKYPHEQEDDFLQTARFLRARQIHPLFGIGLSTWWLWVKEGRAPQGLKLGSRTTVWRAEDIRTLLDELSQQP